MDQNSKEKKLFFFGQPGCLNVKFDIPIRPSNESSKNEETINSEGDSKSNSNDEGNAIKTSGKEEDAQELLKKIDEVLEGKQTPENDQQGGITEEELPTHQNSQPDETKNDIKQSSVDESDRVEKPESALEPTFSASTETLEVKNENVNSVKCIDNSTLENDVKCIVPVEESNETDQTNEIINECSSKSIESNHENIVETECKEKLNEPIAESSAKSEECQPQEIPSVQLEDPVESERVPIENVEEVEVTNETEVASNEITCESEIVAKNEDTQAQTAKTQIISEDPQALENSKVDEEISKEDDSHKEESKESSSNLEMSTEEIEKLPEKDEQADSESDMAQIVDHSEEQDEQSEPMEIDTTTEKEELRPESMETSSTELEPAVTEECPSTGQVEPSSQDEEPKEKEDLVKSEEEVEETQKITQIETSQSLPEEQSEQEEPKLDTQEISIKPVEESDVIHSPQSDSENREIIKEPPTVLEERSEKVSEPEKVTELNEINEEQKDSEDNELETCQDDEIKTDVQESADNKPEEIEAETQSEPSQVPEATAIESVPDEEEIIKPSEDLEESQISETKNEISLDVATEEPATSEQSEDSEHPQEICMEKDSEPEIEEPETSESLEVLENHPIEPEAEILEESVVEQSKSQDSVEPAASESEQEISESSEQVVPEVTEKIPETSDQEESESDLQVTSPKDSDQEKPSSSDEKCVIKESEEIQDATASEIVEKQQSEPEIPMEVEEAENQPKISSDSIQQQDLSETTESDKIPEVPVDENLSAESPEMESKAVEIAEEEITQEETIEDQQESTLNDEKVDTNEEKAEPGQTEPEIDESQESLNESEQNIEEVKEIVQAVPSENEEISHQQEMTEESIRVQDVEIAETKESAETIEKPQEILEPIEEVQKSVESVEDVQEKEEIVDSDIEDTNELQDDIEKNIKEHAAEEQEAQEEDLNEAQEAVELENEQKAENIIPEESMSPKASEQLEIEAETSSAEKEIIDEPPKVEEIESPESEVNEIEEPEIESPSIDEKVTVFEANVPIESSTNALESENEENDSIEVQNTENEAKPEQINECEQQPALVSTAEKIIESTPQTDQQELIDETCSLQEIDHSNELEETSSKTDNIINNKVESPCHESTENLIAEDAKEKDFSEPLEESEEGTENDINNDVSESLTFNETEKHEIISQKLITVEENLNEKINDNQVELSNIDNKSLATEKSSTSDIKFAENEFSVTVSEKQLMPIEKDQDINENKSVLQIVDKIKHTPNEILVENAAIERKVESVIELDVEKHHIPDVNDKHEEISVESDSKTCNEVILPERVTEKIVPVEMPPENLFASNEQVDANSKNEDTYEEPIPSKVKVNDVSSKVDENQSNKELEIDNENQLQEELKIEEEKSLNDAPSVSSKAEVELCNETTIPDQKEMPPIEAASAEPEKLSEPEKNEEQEESEQPPVDPLADDKNDKPKDFDDLLNKEPKLESIPITKSFHKPATVTRKRKLTDRKSISESDSDGGSHFVTDSVSNEKSSDEEEIVATKKPRIRNKITATRNTRATRQSTRTLEVTKTPPKAEEQKVEEATSEEKTLQSLKFDYDENEDVAANIAAIKTLICKDPPKKEEDSNESSADEGTKKKPQRRGRKGKRGRASPKKEDAQESSSDESKSAKMHESKRSKTSESEDTTEKQSKKKRESGGRGLLKHLDTSLVIETVETEAPIRQSRRIAQQKIREETERRQMEEKMLKQMKEEAEKRKKLALIPEPPDDDEKDDSDESYQDSRKKKKKKLEKKPSDKPWQTSSSHSEHSESEDEFERPPSEDPGSPLFRSDHEFSPESDDDEAPAQPVKRARTAKKQVEESSSDDEDVNPNHACQVCHKTDCPEWILLCDECDHGYHCSCLKPIIFCIPSGNWYCPLCCHKKLVDRLSTQLEKLDTLIHNIQSEEIRQKKQLEIKKLTEITEENILKERRKNRAEAKRKEDHARDSRGRDAESDQESESNDDDDNDSSDNSSDNAPLYKLRRRNQTTTSYRFNDYDDLINSAIRDEMEEVKGMGNAGRGKDISTIIEADKEEKKLQKLEKDKSADENKEKGDDEKEDDESSGSEIGRTKKSIQRKKKNRKLNNLDETSEEDQASDEDFKGSASSNSDTEEEYSVSGSVSESSLDLPKKKGKAGGGRSTRSAARNRRYDETFIDDNSSDDEPLIKKRNKKQVDSDEDEFDANDEDNSDGSSAEDVDSDDLCDDTDTEESSESNWPRKRKKKVASYDIKKPRKPAKKSEGGKDKAFRAGISKKKILKQSDNESEASEKSEGDKGRRRTRGKKLLYLIEDDYESDDGIKPGIGVVRPETPPEEREMFVKKQEEIKRMLAEKNTEAARQLAVPTIEPLKFAIEKPKSPSPPPPNTSSELDSLSTIPKNVIEGAKALDMDYNKIKTIQFGAHSKSDHPSAHDMSEEDLARMMEEEDFAQHQLRLVGESIGRSKMLELEVKEEAFAVYSKGGKVKEETEAEKIQPEPKKRAKKSKTEKPSSELPTTPVKMALPQETIVKSISSPAPNAPSLTDKIPVKPELPRPPMQHPNMPSIPPLIPGAIPHSPYQNLPPQRFAGPSPHNLNPQDRPSVLSSYIARHEGMPRLEGMAPRMGEMRPRFEAMPPRFEGMPQGPHLRFPPPPNESFIHKAAAPPSMPQAQPQPIVAEEVEEKKKGRRKKYTPLRTDLPESNVPKVAKLDTPATSVIQSTLNLSAERAEDKSKIALPPTRKGLPGAPEIFNPATNPSVITRLLQPQQRPPFGGFVEQINPTSSPNNPNQPPSRPFPEDMKHHPLAKQVRPPQGQFAENPFVPRGMHSLYRGPPTSQPSIYGIPSHHARIPYPFHHLHPNNNLRPNMQEYGAPYNIPPQFGYYAPPAHARHPSNPAGPPVSHPDHPELPPNSARPVGANPNDEQSESSEFGGLVSYFSSQQELD